MNRGFRKWLACAVAVTIAVYNAPYSVEALEVIKDSVQVDSAASPEDEGAQNDNNTNSENEDVQGEDKVEAVPEEDASDEEPNAGTFMVSGTENTDWSYSDKVLTIKANAKDITIKGDGNTTTDRIVVESGFTETINLDGVNIDTGEGAPFLIDNGASPTIKIMKGTNSSFMTNSQVNAGIELNGENANIIIDAEGEKSEWGSLTATLSNQNAQGAGIGSANRQNCGTITIKGGTVTATSSHGAGIGSGTSMYSSCTGISIEGGKVTATSKGGGAGIGSGNGANCGTITIKGGTVEAKSAYGVGIGGTSKSAVIIYGGSVKANSISDIPKDENGNPVYLVELVEQGDFKEGEDIVKVVGQTVSGKTIDEDYKVASNHPDNDNSFYLYMPEGTYTITTHKGVYIVTVTPQGSEIYKKKSDKVETEFQVQDSVYGEEKSNILTEATLASRRTVKYLYSASVDGKYKEEVPTNAGTYYVKAVAEEDDNYLRFESKVKSFTISKAGNEWTTTLSIEGWTYKDKAKNPTAIAKFGNKTIVFTYSDKEDGIYTTTVPENAGTYYVKATVDETDNYTGLVSDPVEFKISKATSSIKFKDGTKLDKIYNGKAVAVTNDDIEKTGSTASVSFKFEKKVNDKFEEITEAPKEAGTYQVIASLDGDDNYNSASTTLEFIIDKADTKLSFEKGDIGKTYDGEVISEPKVNIIGNSKTVTFTWYVKNGEDRTELNAAPTNAGEYKVVASIEADTNYKEASIEKEFKITSADSSIKFKDGTKLDKIYDGKAVAVTNEYIEKTGSTGDVTFTFEKKVDDKFEEITEAPKEAGTYRVKASLDRDDNYNSASTTLDFIISRAGTILTFVKDNIDKTYDGNPIAIPDVNKTGSSNDVTFTWYVKNGNSWDELSVAPTNAGNYKVVASIEADTNYKEASIEKEFTIAQAELPEGPEEGGKIEVTVPEWVEGNETQEPTVTIPEEKPEGEEFTVECYYKEYGADDNTYTEKVPTEAGRYTLKIEIKSANYIKTITKDFTIYAKAPEVTEESGKVDTSTDRIEINTEITEGDTDVYLYCTESTKVPEPPKISSTLRKVNKWEKVTGSNHIFTGLKPNTTYHVWKYDTSKSEGERLTYEYSIKTDTPSTPSIPSKPEEKPEEKPSIGVEVEVVDKIAGENRYDTSVDISQKVFPSKSDKVYLVSGEKFPDALSSAALTGKGDGPILLINDKNIDKTLAEIDRLDAKEIVFIGGNSISAANKEKIRKFAKENSSVVSAFVGEDRYETAVKVAEQTIAKYGNKGKVIIADGRNYPDAVSIASYAAKEGIPVILVNGNKVPNVVKNFLNKYKINSAIIVGGDKAVGKNVEKLFKSVDRVAGVDRYDTSKKIAEKFFSGSKTVFVASGESFADSLSVSYYAGAKNAPILLTKSNSLDNDTREYLEKNKNKDYIIVGGDKAVNPELFK